MQEMYRMFDPQMWGLPSLPKTKLEETVHSQKMSLSCYTKVSLLCLNMVIQKKNLTDAQVIYSML